MTTNTSSDKATWLNWLAITTIVFSTAATFSTSKSGGYTSKAILEENQTSNKWAHYQAKSVKQTIYQVQNDFLSEKLKSSSADKAELTQLQAKYQEKIHSYETEKQEIDAEAKLHESRRMDAQNHGKRFGNAVIYLQLAIMLSALAALLKKPFVWAVGCIAGVIGLTYFLDGFYLFF